MDFDSLKAVCINLKRRPDRWAEFTAQPAFAAWGGRIHRFEAIDGKTLNVMEDPQVSVSARRNLHTGVRRSHYEIVAPNSVAIYHTHVAAWRALLESGEPAMIIMEDDLRLDADSYEKFKRLFSHSVIQGGDWDLLNPGILSRDPKQKRVIDDVLSEYKYGYLFHCYVLSRRGAEKLLARAYPIEVHVDHYAGMMAQTGQIKMYGPTTRIFYQRSDDSDNRGSDGSCQTCRIPDNAQEAGRYLYASRLRAYQLEESILVIGGLLFALYVWRRARKN
jgi:GR25 family glycosyltransferase involved in LPS biosynthesis